MDTIAQLVTLESNNMLLKETYKINVSYRNIALKFL